MGKRGQFSKSDKFYLETNKGKLSTQEMAEFLGVNETRVQKYLDKTPTKASEPIVEKVQESVVANAKREAAKDAFGLPKYPNTGMAVSTPLASEQGDRANQQSVSLKDTSGYIFKGNR